MSGDDDDGIPVDVSLTHDSQSVSGRIGNYVLDAKIGAGGMGSVYRAHHAETENQVALKVLRPEIVRQYPEFVNRFKLEAKAANLIRHPNIATVLDFGNVDGQLFLTMELLEGAPLDVEVKCNGAMSMARAIPILMQIADALGAAHEKGFVHRDVKPPNVFLVDYPRPDFVKVLDFGIAKLVNRAENDPLHTAVNAIMGSPATMSPEQARGSNIDHRADIYALGVVAFFLLTGHYPFSGGQNELIAQHQLLPPPKVSEAHANSTPELDAVVDRALAKKPEDRFQTMEEFHQALAACASAAGVQPIAHAARSRPSSQPSPVVASSSTPTMNGESRSAATQRSRTGMFAAVGIAVVALGGGGAYLALHGGKDRGDQKALNANATGGASTKAAPPLQRQAAPSATPRAHVTSIPAGATVSIGNKVVGTTPLDVEGKPAERLRLHFTKDQFEPTDDEVTVEDPPSSIDVELRALVAEPTAPAVKQHSHHGGKVKAPAPGTPATPNPAAKKPGSEDTTGNPFEGSQ